jgi:hypothetical protein
MSRHTAGDLTRSRPRLASANGGHRAPVVLLCIVALVCAACSSGRIGLSLPSTTVPLTTSTTTTSVPAQHHVTLLPALKVVGNTLELSSGQRLVMRGVLIYAMPFYLNNGQQDQGLAAATEAAYKNRWSMFARIKALGFNTVKIPISSMVYSGDAYGIDGPAAYMARLRAIVNAATIEGLYVVLNWWDSLFEGASVVTEYSTPFSMMKAVEFTFADNPGVIYEPYNEPREISWDQLIVISERMLQFWRGTIGYRGVLIADTQYWSWNFDPSYAAALLAYDRALLGRPDLLIANHRYPNGNTCFCGSERAAWNALVGQYIAKFPLLGSEYGDDDTIGPPELGWGQGFLTYLEDEAFSEGFNGAIIFVWNWEPSAMVDSTTGDLTAWGQMVVDTITTHPDHTAGS